MLPTDHLGAFMLTAFVLIAAPGPSVLFIISRSLIQGRAAGLATVVGNTIGEFVQVMAVAFGVGIIVQRSATLFTIIKLVGCAYLVYLGIEAIRHRRSVAEALGAPLEARTTRRILKDGIFVGIANPKSIVFLTVILPQFVDRRAGHVPEQLLLLGLMFSSIALVSDTVWALAAGRARRWLMRSPRRLGLIGGAGGLVMIGLGAQLALSGRKD